MTGTPRRILVVEDEAMVAEVVERYLRRDGYEVEIVHDGAGAMRAFEASMPDLIVLDVMLPGMDGLDVCRRVREHGTTPVILLTARNREADKVNGLALGADDYVTKPFSPRELVARVEAVLRRAAPARAPGTEVLRSGDLALRPRERTVEALGAPVALTVREFDLLEFLMRHPGRVFTRDELVSAVWGDHFEGDDGTVTVHIRRLRTKIEVDASRPDHLKTVWGLGYRFDA